MIFFHWMVFFCETKKASAKIIAAQPKKNDCQQQRIFSSRAYKSNLPATLYWGGGDDTNQLPQRSKSQNF